MDEQEIKQAEEEVVVEQPAEVESEKETTE